MKRKIALALSAFMVLSMCSCTSETKGTRTTRETKEPVKTSETEDPTETSDETSAESTSETTPEETTTEETTTETTDESSSASASDSTSDPTSDSTPSDTTKPNDPSKGNDFHVDKSVKLIPGFNIEHEVRVYGTSVEYDTNRATKYVSCVYEDIKIPKGFDAVADAIELDLLKPSGDCFTNYIIYKNDFIDMSHDDPKSLLSHIFRFEIYPTRHDDQIVSYFYTAGSFDNYTRDLKGSAFDAKTGERITFENVVTDKDALIAYLYTVTNPAIIDNEFEAMLDTIKDGTISFTLGYNSLILNTVRGTIFLSAPDHSDFLDMQYFGAAPENYSLQFDTYGNNVTWDFDGNGTLDSLHYTFADDRHFELKDVELEYNGKKSIMRFEGLPNGAYCDNMYLIFDGKDYYLYIQYNYEDDIENAYCILVDENGFTYIDDLDDFDPYKDFWIDPACLRLQKGSGVIGALTSRDNYSLIDFHGLPLRMVDYADFSLDLGNFFTTKKDLKATKLEAGGSPIGDITVPADSTIYLMRYYKEQGKIMFKCLFENDYEDYYFVCECKEDFENWDTYIGGIEIEDLFYDQIYYGV